MHSWSQGRPCRVDVVDHILLAAGRAAGLRAAGHEHVQRPDCRPGRRRAPGVTVTVTNVATGVVRTTVTNEEGLY